MKRRGVIAVIASIVASLVNRGSAQRNGTAFATTLSRHQSYILTLVDEADADAYGVDYITIRYQGREVKLSAKEVMDALEGK